MTDPMPLPSARDVWSVGSRISWGAIGGGALVALAIYFLLTVLGAAVGLTVNERVKPTTIQTGAVLWVFVTLSVALFVGGMMTSLFTVGENKVEAIFYGVIMWAFLVALLLAAGTAGFRSGYHGMVRSTTAGPVPSWESGAREAGVPPEVIADWQRKASAGAEDSSAKEYQEAAARLAWFAFGCTWISMLAAALGAWLGAGPTFRVVAISHIPVTANR